MKLHHKIKESNYAYNINNSPSNLKSKKFSFNLLGKNFYDELIKTDINIKVKNHVLSEIKDNSIKESIYSSRPVPNSWRTLLSYQNNVYKIIDNDPKFAYYLGRSQKENFKNKFLDTQTLKNIIDNKEVEKKQIPDFIKEYLLKEKENDEKDEKGKNEVENDIKIIDDINESKSRNIKNQNNIEINDKLISSKLDEYRVKYDLNKYVADIKNKRIKEKREKEIMRLKPDLNLRNTNYRHFLKTLTQNDKVHILRSSISNNLFSKDNNLYKSKTINNEYKTRKIFLKPFKKDSNNLLSNKELEKNIIITNPKIKRDLELINYYGPRYTHCKICNNRNLEFYQNSEPNQTLKLLNYLKKIKLKDNKDDD